MRMLTVMLVDCAINELLQQNIGARRLHTVIERIVDEISFDAADAAPGTVITVTADLVKTRVSDMIIDSDLSRYIL
jgi:ATP-dependent HslUV protease ATP-binding subunit HslU